MEAQILKKIQEIRKLLSVLIGTSDLPKKQQFSLEALDMAAKDFKKLSIERGEWITEYDITKIIRKAPYNSGKFIIENFGFINYFKRGKTTYYNRKSIIALNNELKERNINLGRYIELLNDKEKFRRHIESTKDQSVKKKRKLFHIPNGLINIDTRSYTPPSEEIILQHISSLKEEFERFKLAEYIDIYESNYAMFKFEYHFDRYLQPELKKRCKKWCSDFNYANYALKESKKPY